MSLLSKKIVKMKIEEHELTFTFDNLSALEFSELEHFYSQMANETVTKKINVEEGVAFCKSILAKKCTNIKGLPDGVDYPREQNEKEQFMDELGVFMFPLFQLYMKEMQSKLDPKE